jgi:hypothetical protein
MTTLAVRHTVKGFNTWRVEVENHGGLAATPGISFWSETPQEQN